MVTGIEHTAIAYLALYERGPRARTAR